MTVQEVIDFTDRVKPNDFTEEDKTKWISNVEGLSLIHISEPTRH